ncbi:MAG TPA: hypothetical protein VGB44_06660 [Flavobacterium sp.]|jgi:hypothetical protein
MDESFLMLAYIQKGVSDGLSPGNTYEVSGRNIPASYQQVYLDGFNAGKEKYAQITATPEVSNRKRVILVKPLQLEAMEIKTLEGLV